MPFLGKNNNAMITQELYKLANYINVRRCPYFSVHIRNHLSAPGFLTEGNSVIDNAVSAAVIGLDPFAQARASHSFFHQSALGLQKEFELTRTEARGIAASCPDCARIPPLQVSGVNPRGLCSRSLFQTDVTIVPSFGMWKYVHVTIDAFSKMVWATAMKNSKSRATCRHWLEVFAAIGVPEEIKTDNGPHYVSAYSVAFLRRWGIRHTTGVPFNSTGQGIVECKHQDLKRLFSVLRKEGEVSLTPQEIVLKAIYVHNWKSWVERPATHIPMTPVDSHFSSDSPLQNNIVLVAVWHPHEQQWGGPHRLLTWGRGYACVLTGSKPTWLPAKWVKPWLTKAGGPSAVGNPGGGNRATTAEAPEMDK